MENFEINVTDKETGIVWTVFHSFDSIIILRRMKKNYIDLNNALEFRLFGLKSGFMSDILDFQEVKELIKAGGLLEKK